ncbi:phosphate regulon sensor protein PhoR [bacterium BMS3Bbin11]|nr:phosphate regulon sensor protein PhoR [bacterium BMS3Bbin11]GMT41527.1 MAG: phosphate regulon sensor protein PhoR [bacterium]HDH16608.1 phosphate regulon sensor histidine kinase PhoR [Gammaproteobacteria bacterium]HDZ77730.1 phosphate regulon sensor histidine kinase PhoR [Gammaproteobacteria bacterium]
MNKNISQEAWRLFWVLSAGIIAGLMTSQFWPAIALALLAYCIWQLRQLFRLDSWIQQGLKRSQTPNAGGVLENIISNVYRLKTSRKRGKKQLAQLLGQYRDSAEALPDATVILTTTGEIQWFNEAAETLLGLQSRRDLGQRIDNLLREPKFRKFLQTAKRQQELRLTSPLDNEIILSCRLINYGQDKLLLTVRDVSIREQLNRVRREFVSNASHELRTPLTVIRGYLDVISADNGSTDELRDKIHILLEQTTQMENIINEMLTLSRLENSTLEAGEGETLCMAQILRQLALDVVQSGRAETGQITVTADDSLCLIGMRPEIMSLCNNLLYNALQHNPAQTAIELQWFRSGSGAPCLAVNDDGEGIEQQHLSRLTERFYRVDSSRSRESGGTGLGLAIVKHIVQRHGGYIDISSTPAVGSSFTCCFATSRAVECGGDEA